MLIFAIETSCDETSVCILNNNKKILAHIVYSQKIHEEFGGVIPELASRSHLQILQQISKDALRDGAVKIEEIDIFCATCGPGLIGGLLVGSIFAKGLAVGQKKPFIPINHLEGHLLSATFNNNVNFPHISFLLTGGHTQIYLIKSSNEFELLGETLDDAIGEAFDKVAKLLGMPYPGGAHLEKKANKGNKLKYTLPHPLEKKKTLNFSFSGIKTAVNLIVKNNNENDKMFVENLSASFQETICSVIVEKVKLTYNYLLKKNIKINQISLVGGVASNKRILNEVKKVSAKLGCSVIIPPKNMLSDNAAMIAWACLQKKPIKKYDNIYFKVDPRLKVYKKT